MASQNWAGDFDCGDCRQKRLTAASFSKSMANRKRADPSAPLRCLECVAKRAEEERAVAVAKSRATDISDDVDHSSSVEYLRCSACNRDLTPTAFSAKQRRKETGARCSECITKAEAAERAKLSQASKEELCTAQKASSAAKGGSAVERLMASANETAVEASIVTGLKPVKLGRGRGSWRARARGRGGSVRGRGKN